MQNINKTYEWTDIAKKYPNMWAFITDVKEKNGVIKKCRLLVICSFEERDSVEEDFIKKGKPCVRTTFSIPNMGVLI